MDFIEEPSCLHSRENYVCVRTRELAKMMGPSVSKVIFIYRLPATKYPCIA